MHGVLRPGTVTLLLGPPGAGKTVFLQTLAGRMQGKSGVRVRLVGWAGLGWAGRAWTVQSCIRLFVWHAFFVWRMQ